MIYLVTNQFFCYNSDLFKIISLEEGIDLIKDIEILGLDTETQGLDCYTKKLLLLQIGIKEFQVLFDIQSFSGKIPKSLKDFLNTSKSTYILQNAKFDLKFLFHQGIILKNVYDTMLAEIILTNGMQYSGRDLATIVDKYCQAYLDKSIRGEIITKGLNDNVLVYGAKDVMYLPEVRLKQLAIAKDFNLLNAIALDNSFVVVLAYVEYFGIKLDFEKWKSRTHINIQKAFELKIKLDDFLWNDKKYKWFSGMQDMWTGKQECIINWDSPKQVIELFKSYGIKVIVREKGIEKESIDAKVLEPQKDKFEILPIYLEYKAMQKVVSTYGLGWSKHINPVTGRIHTTYKQLMDTGRLSCGDKNDETPNLQNIPSDALTRSCFIPEKGNVMIDADYSGQETIVLANSSNEKNLISFYQKGLADMHSYVAFLMYENIRNCTVEEVSPDTLEYVKKFHKDKRQIAKAAGFAITYGGNGSTIAKNCNIPAKDGEFVYNSYFEAFPEMKNYFEMGFKRAAHFGYVEFNKVTRRKYFFRKDNDYFQLRDIVEDPFFYVTDANPRETKRKYSKAKSDIQRITQNYPILNGALHSNMYCTLGELLET